MRQWRAAGTARQKSATASSGRERVESAYCWYSYSTCVPFAVHLRNVPRQNVQRQNVPRHKVPATKRPKYKRFQIQNVPSLKTFQASKCLNPKTSQIQNVPAIKRPKPQNLLILKRPNSKTSHASKQPKPQNVSSPKRSQVSKRPNSPRCEDYSLQ